MNLYYIRQYACYVQSTRMLHGTRSRLLFRWKGQLHYWPVSFTEFFACNLKKYSSSVKVTATAYILARCVLMPVLLDDEEPDTEEILDADDEEAMNLIKFNVSFPLINAVLRDESFPYALRLNTMRLLSSALKGKFIEVCYSGDEPRSTISFFFFCHLVLVFKRFVLIS